MFLEKAFVSGPAVIRPFHANPRSLCALFPKSENQVVCFQSLAHDFVEMGGMRKDSVCFFTNFDLFIARPNLNAPNSTTMLGVTECALCP